MRHAVGGHRQMHALNDDAGAWQRPQRMDSGD
jgi:hypothetical protein